MVSHSNGCYSVVYVKSVKFNLNNIFNDILIDHFFFIYKVFIYLNIYIHFLKFVYLVNFDFLYLVYIYI